MKVEVAVLEYKEVDLIEALSTHLIAWDYDLVSGTWAERYYPGEIDDEFLEISQELINKYDGSAEYHRLCWVECSDFTAQLKDMPGTTAKRAVLQYLKDNIHRAIDIEKTGGYW